MTKQILVVDDTRTQVLLVGHMLRNADYTVLSATTGAEGLEIATREHVDLLLLDIVMPGMDGIEVLRNLRQNPSTASLPVIMVTSRDQPEPIESAYAYGCNDYITKPIDSNELLQKVEDVLASGTVDHAL